MKDRFKLIVYVIILSSIVVLSFCQENELKRWDASSPLTWSDYQGTDKPEWIDPKGTAFTLTGEPVRYRRLGKDSSVYIFKFLVVANMVRSKSWVKPGFRTNELLQHEQLHFDISEYFSQQLLLALNTYTYTKDFRHEIEEIKHKIYTQRTAMGNLYDEHTVHSENKVMQKKWQLYIENLLKSNLSIKEALMILPKK